MTGFEKTYDKVKKDIPPFDSWEKLDGESAAAYAAFCLFRDYGLKDWMTAAIDTERDVLGIASEKNKPDNRQLEINFTGDFENL